jgi:hypothetical protein
LLAGPAQAAPASPVVVPVPAKVREQFKLADFYKKCVVSGGFVVAGSDKVSNHALLEASYLVDCMLKNRDDIRTSLVRNRIRLAVMSPIEFTTVIPEHRDLAPGKFWDRRARGLGPTLSRPAVSCAEENLLHYEGDPYKGENILIHEFAHAIHEIALRDIDPTFDERLKLAFEEAKRAGLWPRTYASTNYKEYWAEGVQSWFEANRINDHEHNHVNGRDVLQEYDPRLAKLLTDVFGANRWRYLPPDRRSEEERLHLKGFEPDQAPKFYWPKHLNP